MTSRKTSTSQARVRERYLSVAYYATLALFFLAGLFPEARVWGFNWWGYFSLPVKICLLAVGIIIMPAISHWSARSQKAPPPHNNRFRKTSGYFWLTIILFGFAFVLFRGTTHFLGDGYQLLSRLAERVPPVKAWDMGASLIHYGLFSLLGGDPDDRARLTYRIISIGSGLGLLVAVALLSRRLFNRSFKQYLFFLGLASGGYMLMFFGYVENYALLVSAMMVFTLVGLLAVRGEVSRWWLAPPLLLAVFIHVFGAILVPALLYVILKDTAIGRRTAGLSAKTWLLGGTVLVLAAVFVYHYLRTHYYFFTFALLPIVPDRFTVEHDTLFSLKHIADMGNLLILLFPGMLIFLAVVLASPVKVLLRRADYRYLLILVISSFGTVYVFNPGIGMPRNWDLFAIVGVPLSVLGFYLVLDSNRSDRTLLRRTVPMIALGLLMLAPRVATQVVPELGIAHFRNYLELDKIRNRNAWRVLVEYYERTGDFAAAREERARRKAEFPEISYHRKGRELMRQARYAEAIKYLRRALELNPLYYNVYANLGGCYLNQGNLDSALVLLKIADGVNPYNPQILNNIGTAYLRKNEYAPAEKYFLKSLRIDSTGQNAMAGLATVYLQQGEYDRSFDYVRKIHALTDMPYDYFRQAGDAFLDRKAFAYAALAYEYAVERGLDSAYVKQKRQQYPQLGR